MATSASASFHCQLMGSLIPSAPVSNAHTVNLENANVAGGESWTQGIASGNIDRIYAKDGTLAAAATDSFNTLAAGSLTDIDGQAIDLDELKAIIVVCLTGAIKIDAPAANFMGFFGAATDFVPLTAGQTWAMGFGAAGLNVATNSKFDIVETAGGAGSTYRIVLVGAQ